MGLFYYQAHGRKLTMNKDIKTALHIVIHNQVSRIDVDAYRKLKYCPYGACEVLHAGKITYLKSYHTLVAFYNEDTKQFYIDELHSMTTRKHITYFLREYAGIESFVPYKKYVGKALVNSRNFETENI